MTVLIVIPARYASTRYPAKPLAMLKGASGQSRSLIERSWRAACEVGGVDRVVVATDDDRIKITSEAFGAEVVMTPDACANGTERCAAAHTPHWLVEDPIADLKIDPNAEISTPVLRCDGATLNSFLTDRKAGRVGGTTSVFDLNKWVLYFSKEVISFTSEVFGDDAVTPVFHHVGVYAYRPDALSDYPSWPVGPIEQLEGLEQLRFMENGRSVC